MKRKSKFYRALAMLMCVCISLSNLSIPAVYAAEPEPLASVQQTVTVGDGVQARILRRIKEEGWDPYTADNMTLEEFYALMELFDMGILPLSDDSAEEVTLGSSEIGQDEEISFYAITANTAIMPFAAEQDTEIIPSEMFTMYDISEGKEIDEAIAEPILSEWAGVKPGSIVKDGSVVQEMFPKYDGYYVWSVSAEGVNAAVLGVIKYNDKGTEKFVYYYLSAEGQDASVSTTTLRDGEKFCINYALEEHKINYTVEMNDPNDPNKEVPADITAKSIFVSAPTETVLGAYSFDVTAPYFYTTRIYREIDGVRKELTGNDILPEEVLHNNGYPLGEEPVYIKDGNSVIVDTSNGPAALTLNDTFFDSDVENDLTIIAVLEPKDPPKFDASAWVTTVYADKRGSSANPDYIWEKAYDDGNRTDVANNGKWNWTPYTEPREMSKNEDGAYSLTWTFQTNGDPSFLLDALELNGTDLDIPFLPRVAGDNLTGVDKGIEGVGRELGKSYTITRLPDGAEAMLEYLSVFHGSNPSDQRIYRLTITGARSNVTVTGGNLNMYGAGANEFIPSTLVGVHADVDENGIQTPAFQKYYKDNSSNWTWATTLMSEPVVSLPSDGDPERNHANIRFKLADGYSEPYYSFENTSGKVVGDQISFKKGEDGSIISKNEVRSLPEDGSDLDPRFIYGPDEDDWYYIRLIDPAANPISKLYITAVPVRYVVHYLPGIVEDAENMPTFEHGDDSPFYGYKNYDDNYGNYYDVASSTSSIISVSSTVPDDPGRTYLFDHWTLVDEAGKPVEGVGNIYRSNALAVRDVNEYAVPDIELGGADVSICVIRLEAQWTKVERPFFYTVQLRWADTMGRLYVDSIPLQQVLTEENDDKKLYIFVNKDAKEFRQWLKEHPTYEFWDDINNMFEESKIGDILDESFPYLVNEPERRENGLNLLTAKNFTRLGDYAFSVDPDGIITIWMREKRDSLVFRNEVQEEAFIGDEEFYYTVTDVTVGDGENEQKLNGPYYAYSADMQITETSVDDAYTVTFKDGDIINIEQKDESIGKYFTLKKGEGIRLYVPSGKYTITECGSKSGGSYKVDVSYVDDGKVDTWVTPEADELRIMGSDHDTTGGNGSKVSAKVDFDVDADHAEKELKFDNMTCALAIEKQVPNSADSEDEFKFNVTLKLPKNAEPLRSADGAGDYYFNYNLYDVGSDGTLTYVGSDTDRIILENTEGNYWKGKASLKAGQRMVIVMAVPETVNAGAMNYTVEEIDIPDEYHLMTDKDNPNPREGIVDKGELAEELFVNIISGSLIVSNTVTGTEGDKNKEFTFTVKLDDASVNGTYGDMIFTDGTATFTLKHGESKIAAGLPAEANYTVTEAEANKDGYITTASGDNGAIPVKGVAIAEFINRKDDIPQPDPETGSLTVTKTVAGTAGDTERYFNFKATIGSEVFTFVLKDGEHWTSDQFPDGTPYTVTELEADQDGYTTTMAGESGTITENATAYAEFINHKDDIPQPDPETGSLTVTKTVAGTAGDRERYFNFKATIGSEVFTFVLKNGEHWTSDQFPDGTSYTVTELEADQDGYKTTMIGESGIISANSTAYADFINRRDKDSTLLPEPIPPSYPPVRQPKEPVFSAASDGEDDKEDIATGAGMAENSTETSEHTAAFPTAMLNEAPKIRVGKRRYRIIGKRKLNKSN